VKHLCIVIVVGGFCCCIIKPEYSGSCSWVYKHYWEFSSLLEFLSENWTVVRTADADLNPRRLITKSRQPVNDFTTGQSIRWWRGLLAQPISERVSSGAACACFYGCLRPDSAWDGRGCRACRLSQRHTRPPIPPHLCRAVHCSLAHPPLLHTPGVQRLLAQFTDKTLCLAALRLCTIRSQCICSPQMAPLDLQTPY